MKSSVLNISPVVGCRDLKRPAKVGKEREQSSPNLKMFDLSTDLGPRLKPLSSPPQSPPSPSQSCTAFSLVYQPNEATAPNTRALSMRKLTSDPRKSNHFRNKAESESRIFNHSHSDTSLFEATGLPGPSRSSQTAAPLDRMTRQRQNTDPTRADYFFRANIARRRLRHPLQDVSARANLEKLNRAPQSKDISSLLTPGLMLDPSSIPAHCLELVSPVRTGRSTMEPTLNFAETADFVKRKESFATYVSRVRAAKARPPVTGTNAKPGLGAPKPKLNSVKMGLGLADFIPDSAGTGMQKAKKKGQINHFKYDEEQDVEAENGNSARKASAG